MAIQWRLKSYLAQTHNIWDARKLQKRVLEQTNVKISHQNLCKLMHQKPSMIRLSTLELICTALQCELKDFCRVTPSRRQRPQRVRKLAFENTPHTKRAVNAFPDPADYEQEETS